MILEELYHKKQQDVLRYAWNNDYFMLINHGAKRSGKTKVDNDIFLSELQQVKERAKSVGVDNPQYILAGTSIGAVKRNVINELENDYGLEINLDKFNTFNLFGVDVICFGHEKISHLKKIRGMTSFGAYINEGTMANEEVFDAIKSRCSGEGAKIIVDTNPDHPEHYIKKDYIDNPNIIDFHWELEDNTYLSDRYIANIKNSTPNGVFFKRNIKGLWVMAEGAIYENFNKDIHYISRQELAQKNIISYWGGIDWGYAEGHAGTIVVVGEDDEGNYYLIEEHSKEKEDINYWIEVAQRLRERYIGIYFYADTARPEHIDKMIAEGIDVLYADKSGGSVLSGIELIESLYKTKRLFIVEDNVNRFKKEIYMYIWGNDGKPVKKYDNVMDALRYALYTEIGGAGVIVYDI